MLFTGLHGSLNFARQPFFYLREKPVDLGLVIANHGQSPPTLFKDGAYSLGVHPFAER
ncbi:MAG: hypothetical protein WBV96_13780 [Polyangia bacterium]